MSEIIARYAVLGKALQTWGPVKTDGCKTIADSLHESTADDMAMYILAHIVELLAPISAVADKQLAEIQKQERTERDLEDAKYDAATGPYRTLLALVYKHNPSLKKVLIGLSRRWWWDHNLDDYPLTTPESWDIGSIYGCGPKAVADWAKAIKAGVVKNQGNPPALGDNEKGK